MLPLRSEKQALPLPRRETLSCALGGGIGVPHCWQREMAPFYLGRKEILQNKVKALVELRVENRGNLFLTDYLPAVEKQVLLMERKRKTSRRKHCCAFVPSIGPATLVTLPLTAARRTR